MKEKTTTTCSVYAREGEMGKSSVAPTISEVNQFRSEVNETTSEVNQTTSEIKQMISLQVQTTLAR